MQTQDVFLGPWDKEGKVATVRTEWLVPVELDCGTQRCKVLVDDHPDLAVGRSITLDDEEIDPQQRWDVVWVGQKIKRASVNRGWQNNI